MRTAEMSYRLLSANRTHPRQITKKEQKRNIALVSAKKAKVRTTAIFRTSARRLEGQLITRHAAIRKKMYVLVSGWKKKQLNVTMKAMRKMKPLKWLIVHKAIQTKRAVNT